jgi:uncharacterized protein (DUF1501 family)
VTDTVADTAAPESPAPESAEVAEADKPKPPPSTVLLLARHAVTAETGSMLSGRKPGIDLSDKGREQANLLGEVSKSMLALQRAMEQLERASVVPPNCMTAFTASDFSRTFPANGQGSDHGWGSHHMVLGGAVNGGHGPGTAKTYGRFPDQTINGPDDTNTGRWIPSTAIDQYCATLASWFGVTDSDLNTVFPNLNRFATRNLGFMS